MRNTVTSLCLWFAHRVFTTNRNLFLLLGLAVVPFSLQAQIFTDRSTLDAVVVSGATNSTVKFADVDNDGDYDLLVAGQVGLVPTVKIYNVNGISQIYSVNPSVFVGLQSVTADFGDVNGDGFIDLVMAGINGTNIQALLYFGGAGGNFNLQTAQNISGAGVINGDLALGDYDNDGDLDLAVMGDNGSVAIAKIFKYENGSFGEDVQASQLLIGAKNGDLDWGDYDNDGFLDLVIVGTNTSNVPSTKIYNNLGGVQFTPVTTANNLTQVEFASVAWGDYDNDGDLDLLMSGETTLGRTAQVIENQGSGSFQDAAVGLTDIENGDAVWGDFNLDGYLDVFLTGDNGSALTSELYFNQTNGTFGSAITSPFSGFGFAATGGAISVGDFSGDNRLDIALVGDAGSGIATFKLLRNEIGVFNTTLAAPNIIGSTQVGSAMKLEWTPPGGTVIPLNTLVTYNLFIGTTTTLGDVDPPLASLTTGDRHVVRMGHIRTNSITISGLNPGQTYWWAVQAIDADMEGSPFSTQGSFIPTAIVGGGGDFSDETNNLWGLNISALDGFANGYVEWVDVNQDGWLDLFLGGETTTTLQSGSLQGDLQLWINNNGTSFQAGPVGGIPRLDNARTAWGDIDNDGDLDLAVCGDPVLGSSAITSRTSIWETNVSQFGSISFTQMTSASNAVEDVRNGSLDWGDYDNDGDLDLLITGFASDPAVNTEITRIYRNDLDPSSPAAPSFTEAVNFSVAVQQGEAKFGDYDGDGYLDVAVSGSTISGNVFKVYKNQGDGTFSELTSTQTNQIFKATRSTLDWGDVNNDGFLDLVLGGDLGASFGTQVYTYFSLPPFFEGFIAANSGANSFDNVADGDVELGDYNDDGLLDLIVVGSTNNASPNPAATASLFVNTGSNGTFVKDQVSSNIFAQLGASSAAWGDYNKDGKLDLAISGFTSGTPNMVTKVYENINAATNSSPSAPANLVVTPDGFEMDFSWDPPLGHDPNTVDGLSYSLYIDGPNTLSSVDIRSPHADLTNGFRRVAHHGEMFGATSFTLKNLEPGNYTWGVQTIDQDFEGSGFATGGNFTYVDPTYVSPPDVFPNGKPFKGLKNAAVAWGDYSGDGKIDIAVSGLNEAGVPTTALFLHTSATEAYVEDGNFSNQLDDVYEGSLDFGDVDRDGDLDLLLTGRTSTSPSAAPVTKIYLNNGNGFTNGAGSVINLTGVYRGDAKLVDFDHDGDLDVAYFGLNSVGGDIFVMEKYDAVAGTFSLFGVLPSGLASGISDGEMDWGDYNNDGYQDLLISGTVNNNEFSRLYRNQGDGLFDQVSVAGLDDYESSTLAWADFNADGFLDFAVSGSTGPNQFKAKILRNNQAGGFVDLNLTMTPITEGQLAWADYNNDGHKDLLMVGSDGANREVGLYTYLPNFNTFLKESLATQGLPAVDEGAALAWGDYDRDGKIDMAILGEADTGRVFSIIQNIDPNPSTAPLAPTGLSYAIDGYEVLLQWKSPLGDPDSMGYSYNIVAGYTSGGTNIDPPEAITSTGRRQVAKRGFTNDSTTYRLSGLNDGTIFWRVQAINADFEGSPFSSEFSFPFENPAFLDGRDKFFSSFTGGLQNGDLAFGDYDNDGDPDLLISGDNGTNAFTRILTLGTNGYSSPGLTLSGSDLSDADVYWIDVDGDNDLDAMVTGIRSNNTRAATIYLNNNGNFSSSINPFTGVNNGSIDWADFDNDGDADLLLTGDTGNGLITRVYLNEGGNTFTQAGLNLPGVKNGTARWVDFNRDGFFDIFLTGETTASSIANLYRNNGNGTITFATSVPGLKDASADFGDFNNDGFPDLAISGQSSSQILTRIYPNVAGLGFGTFIPLTGLLDGDVIWGDYDNDGNQDLMTAGYTGTEALSQLYRNDGAGGFETKTIASLPFVDARGSSLAWGDPDGNGKLDLAILGQVNGQPGFGFYYNVTTAADATPSTPGVPTATFSGDTITISWNPPTDAAAGGYSYNLMVGTASNGTDVASPMADLNNGYRKVVYNGNVGYRTVKQLIGLPSDTYHFKVQAVNQDFQGSGFASGIPLAYAAPNLVQSNLFAFDGNAPQGFSDASLTWGDYDNDGDLDFFVMGKLETEAPAARLYRNNNGVFAYDSVRSIPLQNVWNGDASFGDFNEDGWLDLAICGQPNLSNSYQTRIYTNTGFGNFAVNGAASDSITNVLGGDLDWGDYDQDGDLDLIVIGQLSNGNSATRIYENQEGTFVYDPVSESLTGVRNGEVAWGDFNADGFLDIALAGLNGSSPITRIYRSNGLRGGFTDMGSSAPIPGLNHATLAWADIDGDQDLDLAVGGDRTASSFQPYTAVWRYDAPAGSFSLQSTSVPQIREGAVRWADVNDDSYPDLFITGKNGPQQGDRMSAFYLNNGSNPYNPVLDKATSEHLTDINTGSTGEFGDYDQDGKIDLLIVGQANDAFPRRFTGLYRNVNPASNLTPPVPTIVNSSQSADSVVLEWNVASYAGVEKSLAYNLYLFNTTTGQDAGAVMAELPSGSRKVVARGLASTQQKYVLRGLQAGKYYWSVQAIEQDFEGGTFAPRDSFIYDPPIFVDVNSIVFDQTPPGLTESAVYWVDYDQDQDLDIALAGDNGSAGLTAVYENVDGTYFVRDAANSNTLENVRGASMSWEDINLDGFPDVVIAGNNGNPFIRVYLNDGNGNLSFSAEAQALSQNLAAVEKGSLDFADFDNDGDPDLLVSGQSLNGSFAEVYKNDRGQALIPLALNLSIGGEGKWADYDRDGLMDFVLSGTDSGTPKTSLFHNEGDDTFAQIDAAQSQLPDLTSARLDWGDADNDGFLDLALSGLNTGGNPEAAVYLNDGTGVFSSSFTFTDAARGDIAFGDYNDDHLMDVVLTGEDNGSRIVRVEKNTGNGTFSTDAKATNNLAATSDFGAIAWGDYNGDQKLDLLVSGETSGAISSVFTVYRNDDLNPNNTIEAPSDLTAEIVAADVKLSWNAPTNVAQPFLGGLTYNLVIGTMEGEGNTKPALAQTLGPKSGLREVARLGNIGQVRSWILDGDSLRKGETYFWGVQAIGVDFEGSPFNLTGKFTFNPPAFEDVTGLVFPGGVPLGIDESVIILGDYDDDGDLDIFSAGQVSDVAGSSSFFLNQSNSTNAGRFDADVPNTNAVLPLRNAAADWGDYDGDGDLDLVVSGLTDDDLVITRVYNNQDATFVWDEEASGDLRQVQLGSLKWGDYNNDGDLDLLLTGEDAAATLWTVLYDNEDGRFTPLVLPVISGSLQEEEFEGVKRGTAIWGDYDADGFLDIAVTGLASTGSYTRIFSNLGSNRFREKVNFNLSQLQNSDADFGDFDNDGDLDLLISGDNSTQTTFRPLTVSYIYDRANDNFVENAVAAFEHVTEGNVRWGDFNDDGQPDVLISGKSDETPEIVRTTRLYRNEGDSTFSEDLFSSAILEDVNLGSSSWGDFNGNGKLDVFLTGRDTAENRVFAVYRNIDTTQNKTPGVPTDLDEAIDGAGMRLSWDPPLNHPQDLELGLAYNVYVRKVGQPDFELSPQSDINDGYRKIVQLGNAQGGTSWTIYGLEDGQYEWSVQATDQDFEGSIFANPRTFDYVTPVPDIIETFFPERWTLGGNNVESYIRIRDTSLVAQTTVRYRAISDSVWQTSSSLPLAVDTFSYFLGEGEMRYIGLEYFYEVEGKFGFDIRSDTGRTFIYHPDGLIFGSLKFGKTEQDYNLLAFPLRLENTAISDLVEDDFGTYNPYQWRFWHYDNGALSEYTEGLTSVEDGKGYWLITKKQNSFRTSPGTTVEVWADRPYKISLKQGYNQVGNPYDFNVAWEDILRHNLRRDTAFDQKVDPMFTYDRAYQNTPSIPKREGAFFFAAEAVEMEIPVFFNDQVNRTAAYRPSLQAEGDISSPHWRLPIWLESGNTAFQIGGIGMDENASPGKDPFDRILPPRLSQYLDMHVYHEEFFAPHFSWDVVPAAKFHVWEVMVETNLPSEEIMLRWDPSFFDLSGMKLYLLDVEHQQLLDMSEQGHFLSISQQAKRPFRIYFGSESNIFSAVQPDKIHLGRAYPNPSSGPITIPFALPNSGHRYELQFSLLDMSGRRVMDLGAGDWQGGFHELRWDGKNQEGIPLPPGVYIYQMIVTGSGQKATLYSRLIIK